LSLYIVQRIFIKVTSQKPLNQKSLDMRGFGKYPEFGSKMSEK